MWQASLITWAVVASLHGQAQSQLDLCLTKLLYGGTCVDLRETCTGGSFEYTPYSNYIGCSVVTKKCCANQQGPIKNPGGIIVTPSLTCGIGSMEPASRILDGIPFGPCNWPFTISFRAKKAPTSLLTYEETAHVCQGVIVGPWWVLTSPVCILSYGNSAADAPSLMIGVAGEYNVSGLDINPVTLKPMEQIIKLGSVYIHPEYKFKTQAEIIPFTDMTGINSNGLALVKLAEPIKGQCSGIACLPTISEAANDCTGYDNCIISGWGYDKEDFTDLNDALLFGRIRLTSKAACNFLAERLNITKPIGASCQSPLDANTNSCLGDEGGAILCAKGNNWIVRGILPLSLCQADHYDFFVTDVAPYLSWIETTMTN